MSQMEKYGIGVDFGGTNLRIAAYAGGKDFLKTIQLPTRLSAGRDVVVQDMCESIIALLECGFDGRSIAGIAVGAPGPLELPNGILRNPPNLHGWDGFCLREAIESWLGRSIQLDNDANMAALAEQRLGAGKTYGVDSLCVLTLGTGVGNGLIIDGIIRSGSCGMGAEAGHMIVETHNDTPCGCGGFGCLEQYASASALVRMARERGIIKPSLSASELAAYARDGQKDAIEVFRTVGSALAIGLTGLINTLNLPLYLLGGGLSEAWDLFAPVMFEELRRRCYVYRLTEPHEKYPKKLERHKTYIQRAELGSTAGLLGACVLACSD
jgi:glucokinase